LGFCCIGCILAFKIAYHRISGWSWCFFLSAFLLILPLSLVTIQVVPALHNETDLINAVKMGYPAFWSVLLIGIAS
jgi:hypothetical protein